MHLFTSCGDDRFSSSKQRLMNTPLPYSIVPIAPSPTMILDWRRARNSAARDKVEGSAAVICYGAGRFIVYRTPSRNPTGPISARDRGSMGPAPRTQRLPSAVLTQEETLNWLALRMVPGLGTIGTLRLLEKLKSPQAIFRASATELEAAGLTPAQARNIATGFIV